MSTAGRSAGWIRVDAGVSTVDGAPGGRGRCGGLAASRPCACATSRSTATATDPSEPSNCAGGSPPIRPRPAAGSSAATPGTRGGGRGSMATPGSGLLDGSLDSSPELACISARSACASLATSSWVSAGSASPAIGGASAAPSSSERASSVSPGRGAVVDSVAGSASPSSAGGAADSTGGGDSGMTVGIDAGSAVGGGSGLRRASISPATAALPALA